MPSITEIAQYAGVSKSTVSLVLNNKPGVSKDKRQQVLNAANVLRTREEALNLVDNDNPALGLNGSPLSIVVLHPAILESNHVYAQFLQGIQAGASLYQVQLSLATNEPHASDHHISRLYITDPVLRPDGLLIMGARQNEPFAKEAVAQDIPYLLFSRHSPDPTTTAVGWDDKEAALKATNYLLNLGHKAIAFVGGHDVFTYTNDRLQGYRLALQTQGITPQPQWVALGDGQTAAEKILETCPEITAAIFVNDKHAMAGVPVFQMAGRTVPADLSVISFDDTEEIRTFDPPLTSILFPRYQTGLWAVKTLVEKIRNPLIESMQVVFKSSLTERQSCAPPKQ